MGGIWIRSHDGTCVGAYIDMSYCPEHNFYNNQFRTIINFI